jgi:hypothetical protein
MYEIGDVHVFPIFKFAQYPLRVIFLYADGSGSVLAMAWRLRHVYSSFPFLGGYG